MEFMNMANIKNFGLVGVGSDVQFGKAGPRLKGSTDGAFKFYQADGTTFGDVVAGNLTADSLKGALNEGKLVVVDADGKLGLGSLAADAASKAYVDAADATLQGNIDTVAGDLASEVTRATDAEGVIAGNLAAEVTRATNAEGVIAGNLATEIARATAAEGVNAAAILAEETRALAAEGLLSGRITTEVADRAAAVIALNTRIDNEHAEHVATEAALQTAVADEIAARIAGDTELHNKIDAAVVGLAWENPIDEIVADKTTVDLVGKADGYRIVDTTDKKIYTVTGETLDAGEVLVDGAAFFNRTTDVPYVFNGTTVVQFAGAQALVAGVAIEQVGNALNVKFDDVTVKLDGTGKLRVAQAILDDIATNATAIADEAATRAAAVIALGTRIDDETSARIAADAAEASARAAAISAEAAARIAADDAEEAARIAADSALQTAIAAEQSRAEGVEGGLNTRLTDEEGKIVVLEAASADHETRIFDLEALATNSTADLLAEINEIELSLGLDEDGTKFDFTSVNKIAAGDTFFQAINKLDAALQLEQETRVSGDNSVTANFQAADAVIAGNLAAEITRATTAENAIASNLTALTSNLASGGIVFGDGAGGLLTDAGISYNAVSDTLTVGGAIVATGTVSGATPTEAAHLTTKAYVDAAVATGVTHAARGFYITFGPGKTNTTPSFSGMVTRVKISVTAAGNGAELFEMGPLVATGDVDTSATGLYVIEQAFDNTAGGTFTVAHHGVEGVAFVEYL
jgi:trimeric autotransporter adhesin